MAEKSSGVEKSNTRTNVVDASQYSTWLDEQIGAAFADTNARLKERMAANMADIDDDIFLMSSRKVPLSQAQADAVDQSTANGIAANLKARLGQQLERKQRGLLSEFAKIDPLGGRSFMDAAYSPDAVLASALRNVGASINPQRGIISDEVARFNSEIQEHNARMANEAGQSQGGWGDSIQPSPERLTTLGQEVAKNTYIVDKLTSKEGWSSIGTMFKSSIINSLASNRPGFNFGVDPVDSFTESQRVAGVQTLLAVPMAFEKELDVLSVTAMVPRVSNIERAASSMGTADAAQYAQLKNYYASLDPNYVSPYNNQVSIFAFEGNPIFRGNADYNPLLGTGHLGVSIDNGKNIYAFGPIVPDGMPMPVFMKELGRKMDFPGALTNDTRVFDDIASNVYGDRLTVLRQDLAVSPGAYDRLVGQINNGVDGLRYRFPDKVQPYDFREINICNCAQYPTMIGIELQNSSGRMYQITRDMIESGATVYKKR